MLDHRLEVEMFAGQSLHSAEMCTRRIYGGTRQRLGKPSLPFLRMVGQERSVFGWENHHTHTHTRAGTHLQNRSDTAEGKSGDVVLV